MNTLFLRAALALVFAAMVVLAAGEMRKPENPGSGISMMDEIDGVQRPPPVAPPGGWRSTGHFLLYLTCSLGLGGYMVLRWVIPALGDRLSSVSAPDSALDPHGKAMVLVSRGDYPAALLALARMARENPSDRLPVTEMARIHALHMEDPASAASVLETALQRSWSYDDHLVILKRLTDLYGGPLEDVTLTKDALQRIITLAGHGDDAAAARVQLDQIEEQEYLDRQKQA